MPPARLYAAYDQKESALCRGLQRGIEGSVQGVERRRAYLDFPIGENWHESLALRVMQCVQVGDGVGGRIRIPHGFGAASGQQRSPLFFKSDRVTAVRGQRLLRRSQFPPVVPVIVAAPVQVRELGSMGVRGNGKIHIFIRQPPALFTGSYRMQPLTTVSCQDTGATPSSRHPPRHDMPETPSPDSGNFGYRLSR